MIAFTWHKNISNLWSPSSANSAVSFALILLINTQESSLVNSGQIFLSLAPSFHIASKFWNPDINYYSAVKKEQINAICSNIDGPRDRHTELSKSDTERQISYDIVYMQNLNKW